MRRLSSLQRRRHSNTCACHVWMHNSNVATYKVPRIKFAVLHATVKLTYREHFRVYGNAFAIE